MDAAPKKRKNSRRRNGEGSTYRHKNGWRTKLTRGTQTVTAMGRSEQESPHERFHAQWESLYDGGQAGYPAKVCIGYARLPLRDAFHRGLK